MALTTQEQYNIKLVWDCMAAILEAKDEQKIEACFTDDFIQHNPWAQDGIGHVKEMLAFEFGYKPIRWVADGDIMAYHGYYTAPNPLGDHPLLCVDAWRVEAGKIKEHWDALAPMPQHRLDQAIAGGGDGELAVSDSERQVNKHVVIKFLDQILNRGRLEAIAQFVHEDYVYHQEQEGALLGREALNDHIVNNHGGRMIHDNKRVLASGDLVMAHSHFFGANERVVFDWFRMQQGKIAEHWSVEQPISPWGEVANNHPHF